MTMNAVAMEFGCSTRADRYLRQRFQSAGRTKDRSRSGRPRVRTLGQDRYIWNIQQWYSVLFSDESRFAVYRGDGRVRV